MPTAAFANLGCKVNQYETEKLIDSFAARGFAVGDFDAPADVYVINTCSVTGAADRKSRHMARRAARQNPDAKVVLTGCFAQMALDTGEAVDGAALLIPNREKMRAAEHTLNAFPELIGYTSSPNAPMETPVRSPIAVFPEDAGQMTPDLITLKPRALRRTRATLKVQDGCVHFCAFCSIPFTRDTMASRSLDAVLAEARQIAAEGTHEIVVTGVCVGAYEHQGARLADLLTAVAEVEGIERVRLSSIQPIETDEALMDALAAHPSICPHLHLSLQSGDDDVLKAMQRPYGTDYFRDLVSRLRARLPKIGITTDIICGFPGETRAMFENTLRFAEEMAFARTHVFRYSPRQRTYAEQNLRDDVSPEEKERRHKALTEVCAQTQAQFAARHLGETVPILVEARGLKDGWMSGYAGNYVRAHFPCAKERLGQILPVTITEVTDDGDALGEMASFTSERSSLACQPAAKRASHAGLFRSPSFRKEGLGEVGSSVRSTVGASPTSE